MSCPYSYAQRLADQYRGYWKEHPYFTASKWMGFVNSGQVRCGYWEWVDDQIGAHGDYNGEGKQISKGGLG